MIKIEISMFKKGMTIMKKTKALVGIVLGLSMALTACDLGSGQTNLIKDPVNSQAVVDPVKEKDQVDPDTTNDGNDVQTVVSENMESGVPYRYCQYSLDQYYQTNNGQYVVWFESDGIKPVIEDSDKYGKLQDAVNAINDQTEDSITYSYENCREDWVGTYEPILNDDPDAETYPYMGNDEKYVTRADDQVFSIVGMNETYIGGAHPATWYYAYNIDSLTGEQLSLSDFVNEDCDIAGFIANQLYTNWDYGAFFAADKEELTKTIQEYIDNESITFYVTEESIVFIFSQYSIAPYAAGSFQVIIDVKSNPELVKTEMFAALDEDYIVRIGSYIGWYVRDNKAGDLFPISAYAASSNYDFGEYTDITICNPFDGTTLYHADEFSLFVPTIYVAKKSGKYYMFIEYQMYETGKLLKAYSIDSCDKAEEYANYWLSLVDPISTEALEVMSTFFFGYIPYSAYASAYINDNGAIITDDCFLCPHNGQEGFSSYVDIEAYMLDEGGYPLKDTVTIPAGTVFDPVGYIGDGSYYLFAAGGDTVALEHSTDDETFRELFNGKDMEELFDLGWE